jgi:methyl-accepting chemotaxis protein
MTFGTWLRVLAGGWLRRKRLETLRDVVESHLPMLPVVDAQLRDTNQQMEQAVTQVGSNFQRMVERAREGVNEASRLVGTGEASASGGVGNLLSTSRTTLEDLMDRIVRDSEICRKLVERMDSLEKDMDRIVRALADVDRISFGNTILALNAKIEAAHIGERGAGFEIVAQELWTQARRSQEITEGIRSTILRLASDAKAAETEVGEMACADRGRIATLQGQVQEALGRLESAHGDMRQSVAEAGARSEALAGEIASAVQAMQFQDRLGQRIVHIVEALESMQTAIEEQLEPLGRRTASETGQCRAAEMLSGSYTMAGERSVHAAALGEEAAGGQDSNDVEIF